MSGAADQDDAACEAYDFDAAAHQRKAAGRPFMPIDRLMIDGYAQGAIYFRRKRQCGL
jgi:hypothetical protein